MIQFKALLLKELKEAFRDKRALTVAMSLGLLAPLLIVGMSQVMISKAFDNPAIYVNISGAEHAPNLIEAFEQENIFTLNEVPDSDRALWEGRNVELTIPDTFADDMRDGTPIELVLRADFNDTGLNSPLRRIKDEIQSYSRTIGYQRLLVRGIDIRLLQPVTVIEQDTALPSSNAMLINLILGLYLIMGAFISGQAIAIDSSAGERERNVLEMLLCQPVSTYKIVMAKLFSASFIAIIASVLMLVLTTISVGFIDLSTIGATFSLDAVTFITLLVLLVPLCFFASALQLFFAFQAKTFKEAQSTVAMLIIVPAFIPFALSMMDDKPQWASWLPVSGQSLLIENLLKGMAVDWSVVAVSTAATIAITVGLVSVLSKRLQSEKVVMSLG